MKNSFFQLILGLSAYLFAFVPVASSQTMIRDTLQIRFPNTAGLNSQVYINRVEDARGGEFAGINSSVVGEYETNHLFFFPVDQLICTPDHLAREIKSLGGESTDSDIPEINLKITSFKFSDRSGLFSAAYILNSSFGVYDSSGSFLGELVYEETVYKPPVFSKKIKSFKRILADWTDQFQKDLADVARGEHVNVMPTGFRPELYSGKNLNMFGGISTAVMFNSTIVDADLYFSRREAAPFFLRSGKVLRYRKENDFESIGFSLINDYMIRRFHSRWVFQGNMQLFFGLNRWNDLDEVDHRLYDAVQGDLCLKQGVYYNMRDQSSLTFGIGLIEDLNYIFSKGLRFDAGVFFQVGVKL
ncbi:hypothetical protein KAR48_04720 [bacterium]|nr:hypothetical protein [bacterium]